MSIRDIVRRERWEINRCAHEAEIALSGLTTSDLFDAAGAPESAWASIVADYVNTVVAENRRQLAQQLVR